MSTIPYILKFNCMGEWARQQLSLFKLRDIYVAYGVRGLIKKVAERSPVNIDPSGQYWHDAANRHLTVLAQYWQTVPAL